MRTPRWLDQSITKLEHNTTADRLSERVRPLADRIATGRRGEVLRGEWLGHALHPMLTDVPLGCWISAHVLDLVGGRASRPAAQRLVGLGVLMVPVTAASGWTDWREIDDPATRRVGAVHGVGNLGVGALYLLSWRSRRRGHHVRGVLLALVGGAVASVTAYLGGHLTYGRGASVEPRGLTDEPSTASWTPLQGALADDLVGLRDAAAELTVGEEQIAAMVAEGMLTPAEIGPPVRFRRADLIAMRLQGG